MNLHKDATQNIADRLVWHTALKDQPGIAKDLADGKEIEEIYGLGEGALFDEFFYFLSSFGISDLALKLGDVPISLTECWKGQQLGECPGMIRHICSHSWCFGPEAPIYASA